MEEVIAHVVQPISIVQSISWPDIIIAFCSLLTSVVAVVISINTYQSQKEHNKNSVRPILDIVLGDYEDNLYIRVVNNGVGPAIITDISCISKKADGEKTSKSLVDLIPYSATVKRLNSESIADLRTYTDFVEDISGRTISPDHGIVLLRMENPSENQRLVLRDFLKDCCVEIHYTDIYNSDPWTSKRDLDFFGRTPVFGTVKIDYYNKK